MEIETMKNKIYQNKKQKISQFQTLSQILKIDALLTCYFTFQNNSEYFWNAAMSREKHC